MDKLVEYNYESLINAPDEFFYKILINNECLNKYKRGSTLSNNHIKDIINTQLGNALITAAVDSERDLEKFKIALKKILTIDPRFSHLDADFRKVFSESVRNWKNRYDKSDILEYLVGDLLPSKYIPLCLDGYKRDSIVDCYKSLCKNNFLKEQSTKASTFTETFSTINFYKLRFEDLLKGYFYDSYKEKQKIIYPTHKGVIWERKEKGSLAYFANGIKARIYEHQKQHYFKVFNDLIQFKKDRNFELKKNTSPSEDRNVTSVLDQALKELSK